MQPPLLSSSGITRRVQTTLGDTIRMTPKEESKRQTEILGEQPTGLVNLGSALGSLVDLNSGDFFCLPLPHFALPLHTGFVKVTSGCFQGSKETF